MEVSEDCCQDLNRQACRTGALTKVLFWARKWDFRGSYTYNLLILITKKKMKSSSRLRNVLQALALAALLGASTFAAGATYVYRALVPGSTLAPQYCASVLASGQIVHPTHQVGLIVPMYSGPRSDPTDWATLESTGDQVPLIVVMNPDNGPGSASQYGPGTSGNTAYNDAISAINQNGNILGYVALDYGADSLSSVENEIQTYADWFPNLDGFFLDNVPDDPTSSQITYLENLVTYIQQNLYSGAMIVFNPGTSFSETMYNDLEGMAPAAGDYIFIDEEDSMANVNATPQAPWITSAMAPDLGEISYANCGDAAELDYLGTRNIDWVYATTLGGSGTDPYSALPPDFSQEVQAAENS